MGIYLVYLVIAAALAIPLWALLTLVTDNLRPKAIWSWQNTVRAILRAMPFALVLAPTLVMKQGLGVLIPASFYILPNVYEFVFKGYRLDNDDVQNVTNASVSLAVVWGAVGMVLFIMQSRAIARRMRYDEQLRFRQAQRR